MRQRRLVRAGGTIAAAAAYLAVGAFMGALYAASAAPSSAARLQWALLGIWTLVLPPVWGLRLGRRLVHLCRIRDEPGLQAALRDLWLEFAALGLGAAVAALAVIRALL